MFAKIRSFFQNEAQLIKNKSDSSGFTDQKSFENWSRQEIAEALIARNLNARYCEWSQKFDEIVKNGPDFDLIKSYYEPLLPNGYIEVHQRRFHELFSLIQAEIQNRGTDHLSLLEIGTTPGTTLFYKKLFPNFKISSVDRPLDTGGDAIEWAEGAGIEQHLNIDLNTVEFSDFLAESRWQDSFDLIVCCEVIEHLERSPKEVFSFIKSMLKPSGVAIITTPNPIDIGKIAMFADGRLAQYTFDEFYNNIDAHHHYREYTLDELVSYAHAAACDVKMAAYSACWDSQPFNQMSSYPYRKNLVVLLEKPAP